MRCSSCVFGLGPIVNFVCLNCFPNRLQTNLVRSSDSCKIPQKRLDYLSQSLKSLPIMSVKLLLPTMFSYSLPWVWKDVKRHRVIFKVCIGFAQVPDFNFTIHRSS